MTAPRCGRRLRGLRFLFLDRPLVGPAPTSEAGLPGGVEGGSKRVVEGAKPDLVAGGDLLACAHEPRAGSPLLGLDDRTDDSLDRCVEAFHEGVGVVEAAPVDADDDLRPRSVQCLPLQSLDRLAADLPVQVTGARACLEAGKRRLVRSTARQDDEAATARGAGRAEWNRLR